MIPAMDLVERRLRRFEVELGEKLLMPDEPDELSEPPEVGEDDTQVAMPRTFVLHVSVPSLQHAAPQRVCVTKHD